MTEGSYKSMDLGELTDVFESLSSAAQVFRPVVDVPDADDYVYQAAVGPTEVSTDQRLAPMTDWPIWDVNGYYRAIGVQWPYRPTKKQMRLNYQRVGGPNNDYSTYAFKQLLDAELRFRYDRRPLGQPIDDSYRWAEARRMASDFAARQSRATGMRVTVEDILGEDLVARMSAQAEAERQAEEIKDKRDDEEDSEERETLEEHFVWPFAYYLLGSRKFGEDQRLADWQTMLVRAFSREALSLHVAVGYLGRTHAAAARVRHPKPEGGHVQILFLHEDVEPSQELADVVVATYYTRSQHEQHEPIYLQNPT